MNKILAFLALFLMFCMPAFAVDLEVWTSSNTGTADTTQPLCGQYLVGTSTVTAHAVIHEVVVSSPTAGGVALYNSSWTTTSQSIGPISCGGANGTGQTVSPYVYDVTFPNGLMYSKTGTSQVQILYQCY